MPPPEQTLCHERGGGCTSQSTRYQINRDRTFVNQIDRHPHSAWPVAGLSTADALASLAPRTPSGNRSK
ncbi:hypothetical protein RE6C_03305 [Rhodopirellula europaea 6C]|uniref:Uncharacterized protein n=1 Tax=Rhodopirellula europaea 6C TaxID=1263867 RepID=M2B2F6_9BACT|nr:hypothetical protein RE6C_03305 [Rhodopirellula europaea 6C]